MAQGELLWHDLTVPHADKVRDFYAQLFDLEWKPESMGDYDDYMMIRSDGQPATGICWNQGVNAAVPTAWMLYFRVNDASEAAALAQKLGGELVGTVRPMGEMQVAFLRDPAGVAFGVISGAPEAGLFESDESTAQS